MQATFPGVEFLRILFRFKKRKENSSLYVHVLIKRQIRRFHVVVVKWTSKKCSKKHDARAELVFWSLNLLFFEVVVTVVVAPYNIQSRTRGLATWHVQNANKWNTNKRAYKQTWKSFSCIISWEKFFRNAAQTYRWKDANPFSTDW